MEQSINTCMALGSSLPIIFANGRPMCLDMMTLEQLTKFIPFMLACEGQGNAIPVSLNVDQKKPRWWPEHVEFSMNSFTDSSQSNGVLMGLRDIVRRCYRHYSLSSIIELSTMMSDQNNTFGFVRIEHNDNGTSNVISYSNKLVVTIRTDVVKYDDSDLSPTTKMTIHQSPYNQELCKTLKTKYPVINKYSDGTIQVFYSELLAMTELNPKVALPKVVLTNHKGQPVRYPFIESTFHKLILPQNVSTHLKGDNVFKVVVLSASDSKEITYNITRNGSCFGSPLGTPRKNAHFPKCRYCTKTFSGEDFCMEHEGSCLLSPKPATIKKTEYLNKISFLSNFDLDPAKMKDDTVKVPKYKKIIDSLNSTVINRPTARRFKKQGPKPKPKRISTFFKNHPIPFTSGLGLELVRHSATGSWNTSTNIDEACGTSEFIPHSNSHNWNVTTTKKNVIKTQNWVHTYCFNRVQRMTRNSEIIIGLNYTAWPALNKCTPFSLRLKRVKVQPKIPKKPLVINGRLVFGNPLQSQKDVLDASTFEGERPIIKIKDICTVEKYAKYFNKNNSTLKL